MSLALSRITQKSTGLVFERHSISAREMIATGAFEAAGPLALSIRERLAAMQREPLEALARSGRVNTHNEQRDYIIERLVPLVERGKVQIPDGVPTHRKPRERRQRRRTADAKT